MKRHVWTQRRLIRFQEMGEIWAKYSAMGITDKRIYEDYIERQYGYGIGTLYWCLNVPTDKLLKAMGECKVIITDENFKIIENGNKRSISDIQQQELPQG